MFLAWVLKGPSKDSYIEIFICPLKIPIYLNTDTFTTINSSFFLPKKKKKVKILSPPSISKIILTLIKNTVNKNIFCLLEISGKSTFPAPLATRYFGSTPLRNHNTSNLKAKINKMLQESRLEEVVQMKCKSGGV